MGTNPHSVPHSVLMEVARVRVEHGHIVGDPVEGCGLLSGHGCKAHHHGLGGDQAHLAAVVTQYSIIAPVTVGRRPHLAASVVLIERVSRCHHPTGGIPDISDLPR